MKQYLLGIDIGTSSCKAALFDRWGNLAAACTRFYPVYHPAPGFAEQDPQAWWDEVCIAVKYCLEKSGICPEEIEGIGVDGQSWSTVFMGKAGDVLANTPIWIDTRSEELCLSYKKKIGIDRIFAVAGNDLQPFYSTGKILWYREYMPEVYKNTEKILQSNSYIVFKLTGIYSQDISQAYGYHWFHMRHGVWDEEMCRLFQISMDMFPPISSCCQVIGFVTEEAAEKTGLCPGTPVAAGGLDAACGALGAGVIHDMETQEQGGQAGGMSICSDVYCADPSLILSRHVTGNQWLLQGGTTGGGGVMRWMKQEFAGSEKETFSGDVKTVLEILNNKADKIPAGSDGVIFLPYMAGERTPIWDSQAKGVIFGLDYSKTMAHIIRASMEGVAFSLRHNLETAEKAGIIAGTLRAVGGSSNSVLWTQIKADITGKTIMVPGSDMVTTLGAAMLAGVGTGFYKDFEEAVRLTNHLMRRHDPNPSHKEVYDKNYRIYLELYRKLKPVMNGRLEA